MPPKGGHPLSSMEPHLAIVQNDHKNPFFLVSFVESFFQKTLDIFETLWYNKRVVRESSSRETIWVWRSW